MLTKRIIPCLDVKNGLVVKGVQFKDHEIVGSILDLAEKYSKEGADELKKKFGIDNLDQNEALDKLEVDKNLIL